MANIFDTISGGWNKLVRPEEYKKHTSEMQAAGKILEKITIAFETHDYEAMLAAVKEVKDLPEGARRGLQVYLRDTLQKRIDVDAMRAVSKSMGETPQRTAAIQTAETISGWFENKEDWKPISSAAVQRLSEYLKHFQQIEQLIKEGPAYQEAKRKDWEKRVESAREKYAKLPDNLKDKVVFIDGVRVGSAHADEKLYTKSIYKFNEQTGKVEVTKLVEDGKEIKPTEEKYSWEEDGGKSGPKKAPHAKAGDEWFEPIPSKEQQELDEYKFAYGISPELKRYSSNEDGINIEKIYKKDAQKITEHLFSERVKNGEYVDGNFVGSVYQAKPRTTRETIVDEKTGKITELLYDKDGKSITEAKTYNEYWQLSGPCVVRTAKDKPFSRDEALQELDLLKRATYRNSNKDAKDTTNGGKPNGNGGGGKDDR